MMIEFETTGAHEAQQRKMKLQPVLHSGSAKFSYKFRSVTFRAIIEILMSKSRPALAFLRASLPRFTAK